MNFAVLLRNLTESTRLPGPFSAISTTCPGPNSSLSTLSPTLNVPGAFRGCTFCAFGFGISTAEAHRAEADCLICDGCFKNLKRLLCG